MSIELADSFSDLSLEDRNILSDYITTSFVSCKTINTKYSAYHLKQRFTRIHVLTKHITNQCFMDAMVAAGYNAKSITTAGTKDWYFNIGVPLYERKKEI